MTYPYQLAADATSSPGALWLRVRRCALTLGRGGLALALVAGLAGCRHKAVVLLPQPAKTPVELEDPPALTATIEEPEETAPAEPPHTPAAVVPKPVVRRRPAPVKEPPVQVAAADPGVAAIGALSSGGETTTQTQQEARDLIAAIEKRLAAIPAHSASQEKEQIRQLRNFLRQAQQALNSGDVEAAKTLATKAKLLMDEVEKK